MAGKSKLDPSSMPLDYCTIACNTAGYDRDTSPLVEVAAVRVRDGRAVERFRSFVSTDKRVTDNLIKNANITDAHLKGAPSLDEVMTELTDFVGDDVLIGAKYARFIKPFLERDALDTCGVVMNNEWRDILFLADRMGLLSRDSLTDLCEHLGVEKEGTHRALVDADATWRCYELMRRRAAGDDGVPEWLYDDVPPRSLGPDTDAEVDSINKTAARIVYYVIGTLLLLMSFGVYKLLGNSSIPEYAYDVMLLLPFFAGVACIVLGRRHGRR